MNITAHTEYGENVRISIPAPTWEGNDRYGTGVTLQAIYVSPRAKRCVLKMYSIWDDGSGACQGESYRLIEDSETLAKLAGEYPEVGEALEKSGILEVQTL